MSDLDDGRRDDGRPVNSGRPGSDDRPAFDGGGRERRPPDVLPDGGSWFRLELLHHALYLLLALLAVVLLVRLVPSP